MPRVRTKAAELARLLNAAERPIYAIDAAHRIAFCNRACLEWIGRDADAMEGLRASYHTPIDPAGLEAVAAGLCPPPTAAGDGVSSAVLEVPTADGRVSRRRARFVAIDAPWAKDRSVLGRGAVLVLVDAEDFLETDTEAEAAVAPGAEDEAARLHERLRRLRRRLASRYTLDRLLGESPAVRRARRRVELAAASRASVLVVGPPGSGRQHVAATIHHNSPAGAMIPLACGVLPPELVLSTIAALARKWSDAAAGFGTLVLNEADQLPPEVQQELTAVFAKMTGQTAPLRLIATAAEPLDELVRRDAFYEELAAALGTITIDLPPLAERKEDLPLLAQLFVEEANADGDSAKQLAGFSSDALDRLAAYDWPGNVDELAQVVAEAHRRARGPEITSADLPDGLRMAAAAAAHPRRAEETIVLEEFLGRIERELIGRALERSKGNKARAARLLGMTRPRLYRRLVQLGMEEQSRKQKAESGFQHDVKNDI